MCNIESTKFSNFPCRISLKLLLFLGCYFLILLPFLPRFSLFTTRQCWVFLHLTEGFRLCPNVGYSHPEEVFILPPDFLPTPLTPRYFPPLKSGFLYFLHIQNIKVLFTCSCLLCTFLGNRGNEHLYFSALSFVCANLWRNTLSSWVERDGHAIQIAVPHFFPTLLSQFGYQIKQFFFFFCKAFTHRAFSFSSYFSFPPKKKSKPQLGEWVGAGAELGAWIPRGCSHKTNHKILSTNLISSHLTNTRLGVTFAGQWAGAERHSPKWERVYICLLHSMLASS